MGLDVSVFTNVQLVEDNVCIESFKYDFIAYVIDRAWDWKIKNLKPNGYYSGEKHDESISYAYSSHNRFRESLIGLIGRNDLLLSNGKICWDDHDKETKTSFHAFINFADNEGCFDWEVSQKIYNDFKKYHNKIIILSDYNQNKYNQWMELFNIARNGGVIQFH